jgi:hypothetical protein
MYGPGRWHDVADEAKEASMFVSRFVGRGMRTDIEAGMSARKIRGKLRRGNYVPVRDRRSLMPQSGEGLRAESTYQEVKPIQKAEFSRKIQGDGCS